MLAIQADAGDVKGQKLVADAIRGSFGGLDVAFLNAGAGDFGTFDQRDEAGFDRSLAVNLKGPFFLVQALLPILANPASIVLNTSINAHIGMPNSSVYAATKANSPHARPHPLGRAPLARRPGQRREPRSDCDRTAWQDRHGRKEIAGLVAQIPSARRGRPSEIASAVVFLASDEAAFTVGSELVIDGGEHALTPTVPVGKPGSKTTSGRKRARKSEETHARERCLRRSVRTTVGGTSNCTCFALIAEGDARGHRTEV